MAEVESKPVPKLLTWTWCISSAKTSSEKTS